VWGGSCRRCSGAHAPAVRGARVRRCSGPACKLGVAVRTVHAGTCSFSPPPLLARAGLPWPLGPEPEPAPPSPTQGASPSHAVVAHSRARRGAQPPAQNEGMDSASCLGNAQTDTAFQAFPGAEGATTHRAPRRRMPAASSAKTMRSPVRPDSAELAVRCRTPSLPRLWPSVALAAVPPALVRRCALKRAWEEDGGVGWEMAGIATHRWGALVGEVR
jgi:hypothetical protein